MSGWSAPSEDELASGANLEYDVLPEDEYIAKVKSIETLTDQPNKYPSKGDSGPTHDMLVVKFDALTFANGDALVDEDDNPIEGPVPFQTWLNPKKVGMVPQPSKTRKFFAAVLGQALSDKINISDFNDLVGKQLIVSIKPNGTYNNAVDFRPIRRSRGRATTPKGPVEGADLEARVTGTFDEDAPNNVSPLRKDTGNEDDLDF